MRKDQIIVLMLVVMLPMSGCFQFYESPGESLHEHAVQHSEPENNEGSEEEEAEYESDEPNIQLEVDSNGTEPSSEYVYVNGTVLSGAGEENDVIVEIAFEEEYFNASAVGKYDLMQNNTLDREQEISDGDTFALTLSIESLMGNTSFTQIIYIKIEELYENGTVEYSTILENYSVVIPFIDSDGDGVTDEEDAFPNYANETTDSDGDGTGDNSDAFPNDANETTDSDGDGVGDNSDSHPNDPALWEEDESSTEEESESDPVPSIGFIGTLAAIAVSFVAVIRRD